MDLEDLDPATLARILSGDEKTEAGIDSWTETETQLYRRTDAYSQIDYRETDDQEGR
jgi:hypothetical protein